jgi:topoisomerase-4 subunit A
MSKDQQRDLFDPGDKTDSSPAASSDSTGDSNGVKAVKGSGWKADGPLRRMIDSNFLKYASYVIKDRAIPDLEDGLKPVQRRILFSLQENDDGKFTKVANIVGHSMQYHPHGDASIADALVALTNKRYLIEGQGNFGNIYTGDPAAASRYIECRLTPMSRNELFNSDLTNFVPNYDGRRKEPVTLPTKLPLLLMLGADGIAVGLSTKIMPHNFVELVEAQIAILQKKPFKVFPDFQTGGSLDVSEYEKGNGKIKVRGIIEKKDDTTLVIRELPFGTTTDHLISSIEDAARKKKILIKSIQDYTAESVEIEVKLTPGQSTAKAISSLYAFTHCEQSISPRLVVIHEGRPREMDVDDVLRFNTKRLVQILKAELELEKSKLLEEIHRKTLVQIFVENRIYKDIEECDTLERVRKAVLDGVNKFRNKLERDVTPEDVEMLLGIPIKRISRFDINRNQKEIGDIRDRLKDIEKHLKRLTAYAVSYLKRMLKTYGGEDAKRRTKITTFKAVEVRELTSTELSVQYDAEKGFLGHSVKGEERLKCSSLDKIIMVWKDGRYRMLPPPDKLFVDKDLIYCGLYDRKKEFTTVYTNNQTTYMKRFTFGGAIQNKEYRLAPDPSTVLFFQDGPVDALYVKYRKEKRQRIHQQAFDTSKLLVKGAKARGAQMTMKRISSIHTSKPKGWTEDAGQPAGALLDF